jgi:hypothetical protein
MFTNVKHHVIRLLRDCNMISSMKQYTLLQHTSATQSTPYLGTLTPPLCLITIKHVPKPRLKKDDTPTWV